MLLGIFYSCRKFCARSQRSYDLRKSRETPARLEREPLPRLAGQALAFFSDRSYEFGKRIYELLHAFIFKLPGYTAKIDAESLKLRHGVNCLVYSIRNRIFFHFS